MRTYYIAQKANGEYEKAFTNYALAVAYCKSANLTLIKVQG